MDKVKTCWNKKCDKVKSCWENITQGFVKWRKSIFISAVLTFGVDALVICLSGGKFTFPWDWSPKAVVFILFELLATSILTQGIRKNWRKYNNKEQRLAFNVLIAYAVIASVGLDILNLVAYKANPIFSCDGTTELPFLAILFFLTNLATVLLIPEILSGLQKG